MAALLVALLPALAGCVTVAEFRKLEFEVNKLKKGGGGAGDPVRVADVATEVDALRAELARIEGRLEVTEHEARRAREEAEAARLASAQGGMPLAPGTEPVPPIDPVAPGAAPSEELGAYREAYDAWRAGDAELCVDRFRDFLQSFPASDYADDAAFWMADCYFKQGDYQTAILRFDDVASRYPTSDKAPEALYRQGEALLRLGPRYGKAAEKAFQRVIDEYPDSRRAAEARNQLDLLMSG